MQAKVKDKAGTTRVQLSDEQIATLKNAGLTPKQIAALPNVRALTSEQIDLVYEIGAIPPEDGTLTPEELAALSDADIDLSDAPEWTDENFARAVMFSPKPGSPQGKEPISIRLDAEVLEYFKRPGAGYQSRINAVLRLWIRAHPNPPQVPGPHRRRKSEAS